MSDQSRINRKFERMFPNANNPNFRPPEFTPEEAAKEETTDYLNFKEWWEGMHPVTINPITVLNHIERYFKPKWQASNIPNEQGMKWTKAIERLPKRGEKVFWKRDNGKRIYTGYDSFDDVKYMELPEILWLDESHPEQPSNNWTTVKPELNKECIIIAASKYTVKWNYGAYWVKQVEDYEGGWFWGLCTIDGTEWGDIDDLSADRYLVIDLPGYEKKEVVLHETILHAMGFSSGFITDPQESFHASKSFQKGDFEIFMPDEAVQAFIDKDGKEVKCVSDLLKLLSHPETKEGDNTVNKLLTEASRLLELDKSSFDFGISYEDWKYKVGQLGEKEVK